MPCVRRLAKKNQRCKLRAVCAREKKGEEAFSMDHYINVKRETFLELQSSGLLVHATIGRQKIYGSAKLQGLYSHYSLEQFKREYTYF
jgi:hypothetical protein